MRSGTQSPADCGGRAINLQCCAEPFHLTGNRPIEQGDGSNVICLRCRRALWVRARFPVSPALAHFLSEMAFKTTEAR